MARIDFIEIECRSLLNRVRGMPFSWTINPYRGCQHACLYCYARRTHEFLGYDAGVDFDSKIVVKRNAAAVLRNELRRRSWKRELVLLGANVDAYQPAEKHFGITRAILTALRDHLTPVSVLTKSTLIERDGDLLAEMAALGLARVDISVGTLDEELARRMEPGAPSPEKRPMTLRALRQVGVPCGIMLAPLMPGLNDSPRQLEMVIEAAVAAGADSITPIVLHLRPGAKQWFMRGLQEHYPQLVERFLDLYKTGAYVPRATSEAILQQIGPIRRRHAESSFPAPRPSRRVNFN